MCPQSTQFQLVWAKVLPLLREANLHICADEIKIIQAAFLEEQIR